MRQCHLRLLRECPLRRHPALLPRLLPHRPARMAVQAPWLRREPQVFREGDSWAVLRYEIILARREVLQPVMRLRPPPQNPPASKRLILLLPLGSLWMQKLRISGSLKRRQRLSNPRPAIPRRRERNHPLPENR